jgi:hypothetical protein
VCDGDGYIDGWMVALPRRYTHTDIVAFYFYFGFLYFLVLDVNWAQDVRADTDGIQMSANLFDRS